MAESIDPDLPWNSENHPGSVISSSLLVSLKNTTPEYVSFLVRSAFIEAGASLFQFRPHQGDANSPWTLLEIPA